MIKVNNLSKEFHEQGTSNELLAVDHVDFTIQNGSFCALVGESGSGKSTLAQLMCGLLVPSSGEVLFEGKNISLCRGKQKQVLRSKIQLILQDGKGAMDPRFTVYQIIAEPIRNFRKLTKKEEELRRFIIEDLHSGATVYESYGAYNMQKRREIITIVDKAEYQKLMSYMNREDPQAFITVYTVSDMRYQPKGNTA